MPPIHCIFYSTALYVFSLFILWLLSHSLIKCQETVGYQIDLLVAPLQFSLEEEGKKTRTSYQCFILFLLSDFVNHFKQTFRCILTLAPSSKALKNMNFVVINSQIYNLSETLNLKHHYKNTRNYTDKLCLSIKTRRSKNFFRVKQEVTQQKRNTAPCL